MGQHYCMNVFHKDTEINNFLTRLESYICITYYYHLTVQELYLAAEFHHVLPRRSSVEMDRKSSPEINITV